LSNEIDQGKKDSRNPKQKHTRPSNPMEGRERMAHYT